MKIFAHVPALRALCLVLAVCLVGGGLVACSSGDEIPDGYQNATCRGEYFRLYVPTQWTLTTESGVSGAYISVLDGTAVSMVEVDFDPAVDTVSPETDAATDPETDAATEAETSGATEGETADPVRLQALLAFADYHMASVSTLTDFVLEKSGYNTMGGKPAWDVTYTAKVSGVLYHFRQVLGYVGGRYYIFTYSTSKESATESMNGIANDILMEIKFYSVPYTGSEDDRKRPAADTPAGMKLVSDNTVAYRFFAPEAWLESSATAASQVYVSETDRSNVSVIGYVPDEDSFSVADYWEMTEKAYKETFTDYKLLSTTSDGQTMGGRNATVYEYTYTLGGVTYRARQTVCVYSYMVVSMTYTALPENYDAHLADAVAMQDALVFRQPVIG